MSAASSVLQATSGIVGAIAARRQGKALEKAAKFEAAILEQRAVSERQAAAVDAEDFSRQQSALRARGIAQLGAAGVAPEGSPLLVDEAFVREGALQEARLIHAGEVRAQRLRQQASLSRYEGAFARDAARFQAFGSLLQGFSGFAGSSDFFGSTRSSGPLNIIPVG